MQGMRERNGCAGRGQRTDKAPAHDLDGIDAINGLQVVLNVLQLGLIGHIRVKLDVEVVALASDRGPRLDLLQVHVEVGKDLKAFLKEATAVGDGECHGDMVYTLDGRVANVVGDGRRLRGHASQAKGINVRSNLTMACGQG